MERRQRRLEGRKQISIDQEANGSSPSSSKSAPPEALDLLDEDTRKLASSTINTDIKVLETNK
jgi:hypothetical protein